MLEFLDISRAGQGAETLVKGDDVGDKREDELDDEQVH